MHNSRIFCIIITFTLAIMVFHAAEAVDTISLSSAKNLYYDGDHVVIFGSVNTIFEDMPITIQIYYGSNLISIAQPEVATDGTFAVIVDNQRMLDFTQVGNTLTIPCVAGTEKIEIHRSRAIPEFGVIAAMILAVAIVSIIVVTAKTRLSLVQRY